jgi:FAD/FMN-containing dehydrogenase
MSKVAHYLQEHLVGEVMTGTDARRYFATDGSILQLAPALIVYPKNENDVRKTARFSWQLAERGRVIPITPRGSGSDVTGASLGNGILLAFPAHMNRVLELDGKANTVVVEPGINYGKLQQTLQTHGRFLPAFPPSLEYSTVGGAIGNNRTGEKSVKYGSTKDYIRRLRVVLANGEVIETCRLNKRELSKKLGMATFEGEIYRSIDTLLEENYELLAGLSRNTAHNNAGYHLLDIRRKDGSFDLSPLIAGSQGTLGIITEAMLDTEPYNPQTVLLRAEFDSLEEIQAAVMELRKLSEPPSTMELVDGYVLEQISQLNPNQLKDIVTAPFPALTLLVEFDDSDRHVKKSLKRAEKILEDSAKQFESITDPERQQNVWKLRRVVSSLIGHNEGLVHSVPLVDGSVPLDRLREFIEALYKLLAVGNIRPGLWGHLGDGSIQLQPRLNLGQVGDRQKAFRFLDEYHKLVIQLGGTISTTASDGRLRTPYLEAQYGPELYGVLQKLKTIFDPYGILNPGVKFGTSLDDLKSMVRADYSLDHVYDHLPRS